MAWTTPATYTTLELVTASKLNIHLRDNTAYLKAVLDGTQTQTLTPRYAAADAVGASVVLGKARGASLAAPAIVSASDSLGTIGFAGYDGSAYREAAQIQAIVDGTPGASDMPGALLFLTSADAGITLRERLRIEADGEVLIGGVPTGSPDAALSINGDQAGASAQKPNGIVIKHTGGMAQTPFIDFYRATGNIGAETGVGLSNSIGWLSFRGYDGSTTYHRSAHVLVDAREAFTGSSAASRMAFGTCKVGEVSSATRFEIDGDNIGLGAAGSYGSGAGVFFLRDAITVPSTNPTSGALLYSEAGALKTRSSGGTTRLIGGAGARVYHNANQSINNNTLTALAFNTERYDTNTIHDTVTNNSRLTVPTGMDGKYLITGAIEWAANADTNERLVSIRIGGATIIAYQSTPAVTGIATRQTITTVYELAAGDYVEFVVRQQSGGALNASAAPNYGPEFAIAAVG